MRVSIRQNDLFSTKLHKFLELTFFNDNKEWVEVSNLNLVLDEKFVGQILSHPDQINEWISLRSDELIRNSGSGYWVASGVFSLFSIAAQIGEIATNTDDSEASDSLRESAVDTAIAAEEAELHTSNRISRSLESGSLTKAFHLPPGRVLKRWVIINTPDNILPERLEVNYTATGQVLKHKKLMNAVLLTRSQQANLN